MDKKLPTVSVGIPAYNEEANIGYLLKAILEQKEDGFVLKEIIVVSDGSDDKTIKIARSISDPRIKVVDDKDRKGQAIRQNEITNMFMGDILVLLNADVLPKDVLFLREIIAPIQKNSQVGLVGCENINLESRTFFEKVINYSTDFKNEMYKEWNNGNNIYMCCGTSRAFSKNFAEKIKWIDATNEDSYSYLQCVGERYLFQFSLHAKIYRRSPNNFKDHIRQSARFINSHSQLYKYFPKELVDNAFNIPKKIILKNVIVFFIKDPILFTTYLCIYLLIKFHPQKKKYSSNLWVPSISSKSLI